MHTVEGLAHASKKALKDIKGLSEMKVEKLKAAGASRATPNLGTPHLSRFLSSCLYETHPSDASMSLSLVPPQP